MLHVLIVLFSGQKSSWTTLAQDGGSNNKIVLIRAHGNTRHRCTLRGLTELLQWPSNQYENLSITITLIWQGFTLFESVRDYAICKTGTRRFLTSYQFIKGKQYSCPPVNSWLESWSDQSCSSPWWFSWWCLQVELSLMSWKTTTKMRKILQWYMLK